LAPGNFFARLEERWLALNPARKFFAALVTTGVVVSLFFLGQMVFKSFYTPLFTGLDPKDTGVITEELKAMNIPYQLTDREYSWL